MGKNQIIEKYSVGLRKLDMSNINERFKRITTVGPVLDSLIKSIIKKKNSPLMKIELIWQNHIDPEISKNSWPSNFRKGILTITTRSNIWQTELLFRRESIIKLINSHLEGEKLKEIVVKVELN